MITITKKEEVVLDQVKIFNLEYSDGIPVNILRKELGFHEYDLVHILEELQDKDLVIFRDNKVSLSESEKEINTVNSKKDIEVGNCFSIFSVRIGKFDKIFEHLNMS